MATVAVGMTTIACGAGATQPDVERIEAEGLAPRSDPIGVMGDTLVGIRAGRNDEPDNVVLSRDRGRNWSAADLPGRPEVLLLSGSEHGLYADDQVAVVVGADAEPASTVLPIAKSEFRVWTTADGDEWKAHVLETAGGLVGAPTVTAVGPLLVASVSSGEGFNLFTSDDRGSSWQRAEISGLDHPRGDDLTLEVASAEDDQLRMVVRRTKIGPERRQVLTSRDEGSTWSAEPCGLGCPDPIEPGDLIERHGETSTDGGATWHEIEVDPPPLGDEGPSLSGVVEVPGGWLAAAVSRDVGDVSFGMLLRSDDGRSWRQMLPPDPCAESFGRSNSAVGDPIRFDGRWYVTYDCTDLIIPEFGVIYAGGSDAREFEPIEATERDDVVFGDPVVQGDRLLVPEFGEDELVALTSIE